MVMTEKTYICLQCGEEIYPNLEECHLFQGMNNKLYLIHTGKCLKEFRPDVYEVFEVRRKNNEL